MQHRFRHIAQLGIILFLFPLFAQAECSSSGYTVVFVNGIFNTEKQARTSADELQFKQGTTPLISRGWGTWPRLLLRVLGLLSRLLIEILFCCKSTLRSQPEKFF